MLAFHGVFGAYGFWLPNDPRGSWSAFVASLDLYAAGGKATKVATPYSLAHAEHDVARRLHAKSSLKHQPVRFTGRQALAVAQGIADIASTAPYTLYALSVMPDHVHLVIAQHAMQPSRILGHLKRGATQRLRDENLHPFLDRGVITRSCWAEQSWKVFLDQPQDVRNAIQYVQQNPTRAGLKPQRWSFIQPFPG